jgi:hypothetical protein
VHPYETQPQDSRDEAPSTAAMPSDMTLDDCIDFVWGLARDGGLGPEQAADVCAMAVLRLSDERNGDAAPAGDVSWVLRVALEECRTSRRLAAWRRPRLVGFEWRAMGAHA